MEALLLVKWQHKNREQEPSSDNEYKDKLKDNLTMYLQK